MNRREQELENMLAEILAHLFYDAEVSGKEYGTFMVDEKTLASPESLISKAVALLGYKPDLITRVGEAVCRLYDGNAA